MADASVITTVVSATVAVCSAISVALIGARSARRVKLEEAQTQRLLESESRNADRKYEIYKSIIELFDAVLLDPAQGQARFRALGEEEVLRRLDEFGTWIVIWGAGGAVRAYHDLVTTLFSLEGPLQNQVWEFFPLLHRLYANFVIEVRHDIGFAHTGADIDPRHVLALGHFAFYRSHLVEASKMPMPRIYRHYKRNYAWDPPWKTKLANDQRRPTAL
jgi:hypothetical protein